MRVGEGDDRWAQARAALLAWAVKTRSGFAVEPASGSDPGVRDGADYWLVAAVGPCESESRPAWSRSSTGRTGAASPTALAGG